MVQVHKYIADTANAAKDVATITAEIKTATSPLGVPFAAVMLAAAVPAGADGQDKLAEVLATYIQWDIKTVKDAQAASAAHEADI